MSRSTKALGALVGLLGAVACNSLPTVGPALAQGVVQRSTPDASPAMRAAEATVREAISRDVSTTLTAEDKQGDLKRFLTSSLLKSFNKGARDFNGDPFTGSQEPEYFVIRSLSSIQQAPSRVDVTVHFGNSTVPDLQPVIRYEMTAVGDRWQMDNIVYVTDKQNLRHILNRKH